MYVRIIRVFYLAYVFGFGSHIVISGCPLVSDFFGKTSY